MHTWKRVLAAALFALPLIGFATMGKAQEEAVPVEAAVEVAAEAAEEAPGISAEMFTVNNTWMMVSTFLVFIMHLGFATVESGLCRAKNSVNILFKNTLIPAIGLLTYALVGFNLMYPGDSWMFGKFFGFAGFGISTDEAGLTSAYNVGYTYWTDFLFQGIVKAL